MADVRDALVDRLITVGTLAAQADDFKNETAQQHIKRLLVVVWRMLSPRSRANFLSCLNDQLQFDPAPVADKKAREEAEITEMLEKWPSVLGSVSDADKGFAMSVMKNRKSSGWWPSEAQAVKMKEVWSKRATGDAE